MTVSEWIEKKNRQEKITMVTCYDWTSARLLAKTSVDMILVGDSAAMVMHGHTSTLPATMEMLAAHVQAVHRGAPEKWIVADLPFLSFRGSLQNTIDATLKLMQAGASAVKLEGYQGNSAHITHLVESGIPVMGHLGLTPQMIHALGGFRVQGRSKSQQQQLLDAALGLEASGCFAIVLECVPSALAREVTSAVKIPVIGIGAGVDCDGQVLVWQDLLGMNPDFKPKFVRTYLDGHRLVSEAIEAFCKDVRAKEFPSVKESYE